MHDYFHIHSNQEIVVVVVVVVVVRTDSDKIVVDPHVLLENSLAYRTDMAEHNYCIDLRVDNSYIAEEYSMIKFDRTQKVKIIQCYTRVGYP